jgi:hypothetical protein
LNYGYGSGGHTHLIDATWLTEDFKTRIADIADITFSKNSKKEDEKVQNSLYQVFMIDNQGYITINGVTTVATTEEEAKHNAGVYGNVIGKLSDYTVIVKNLGSVKIKEEKEVN